MSDGSHDLRTLPDARHLSLLLSYCNSTFLTFGTILLLLGLTFASLYGCKFM